jgi:hypothetical protein
MLVGLKKREIVLLAVPTGAVDEASDPAVAGWPTETGAGGVEVVGDVAVGAAVGAVEAGGAAATVEAGPAVPVEAGDEAGAPVAVGPLGCPALTDVGEVELPLTVGFVTFALRLVTFARLRDVLCRL